MPFLGHFLNGSDIQIGTVPRWKGTLRGRHAEEMLAHRKMKRAVEIQKRGVDERAVNDTIETFWLEEGLGVRGRGFGVRIKGSWGLWG